MFKDPEKAGISPLDLRTELCNQFLKLMNNSFEELLNCYPIEHCHINGSLLVVPIGNKYEQFPFIIFRSYSLNELRSKLFTDKYLLNSHEINVLSLILARK